MSSKKEILEKGKDPRDPKVPGAYFLVWIIHRYLYFKRVYFAFRNGKDAALTEANKWQSPSWEGYA